MKSNERIERERERREKKWKTYNLKIARSDAGEVEGVDGGEEEERGEDDGDGGACHHLLLHCCFCCEVREKKK